MEFEVAQRHAVAAFNELHSPATVPCWFDDAITIGGTKDPLGNWTIAFTLCPKQPLPDGWYWKHIGGRRVMVSRKPDTGEERVVLSWTPSIPPITVFSVRIMDATGQCTVLQDCDVRALDSGAFECSTPECPP
ncbi:hypothetical protein [Stenotrophomonas sp.]|uniref:hypothetical protein n=1 Tax=Stenotrophomonas sp. TaxID=69392 RepID=UPI00289B0E6D|nr:hypothetical protein [Stenotrophomonas sp.]